MKALAVILLVAAAFLAPLAAPGLAEENAPAGRTPAASPLVALLTDYGEGDGYAGILKGAVLRVCPEARLVDITHDVPAFDIRAGARMLYLAAREFPPGTVFVAVVDPGVGTSRRAVAARSRDGKIFVAPDNGLLTLVADSLGIEEAYVVANRALMNPAGVSATFQGRDVFGPVGGYLARGTPIAEVGPQAGALARVEFSEAVLSGDLIRGEVEHVDVYGNVLTNISRDLMLRLEAVPGDTLRVRLGVDERVCPLVRTYGDVPGGAMLAFVASSGRLELAINQGSLAAATGAHAGTRVEVRRVAIGPDNARGRR